jgi:hypothetical protein
VISILSLLLVCVPFGLLASEMLAAPEFSALPAIVSPGPATWAILAIVLLPFATLLASPLLFLAPRGERRRITAFLAFLALALVVEGALVSRTAVSAASAPIRLSETLDQNSGSWSIILESSLRIGSGTLTRDGSEFPFLVPGDRIELQGGDAAKLLTVSSSRRAFLDRIGWKVEMAFETPPDSLVLELVAPRPLAIYDCSVPYKVSLDGLSARIFVGPGFAAPFAFEITTGPDFGAVLETDAFYDVAISEHRLSMPRPLVPGTSRVHASLPLGTVTR